MRIDMTSNNIHSMPPVMTLQEAADIVRLHHTTLRAAIKSGALVVSRPTGRDIRITADQLLGWLANTSTKTSA